MIPRYAQPLSAIIWNNVATGTTPSTVFLDTMNCPWCSVFGTVSGACTITVLYSRDGVNFYASANKVTLAGAGGFSLDFQTGAEYVALQSSASVTATVVISAK